MNYYNEIDPKAAAWLRALIERDLIAPGVVDERSIVDVRPADLVGFTQCHFFAGIGGWSYALRLAGWSDDEPVWTGSCPCQPFSIAGKYKGTDDERHLWPEFARLIGACRPPVVFGEQVASAAGRDWLASVRIDLEATGYAVGAADLCAASVGAPHIRQRLYWGAYRLADSGRIDDERWRHLGKNGRTTEKIEGKTWKRKRSGSDNSDGSCGCGMADTERARPTPRLPAATRGYEGATEVAGDSSSRCTGCNEGEFARCWSPLRPSAYNQPWRDADWLFGRDGRWRPVESGTFPLDYGIPARVVRLRGYGNAIVPQVAQAFIECFRDCM